jgi:hypothetical protein
MDLICVESDSEHRAFGATREDASSPVQLRTEADDFGMLEGSQSPGTK